MDAPLGFFRRYRLLFFPFPFPLRAKAHPLEAAGNGRWEGGNRWVRWVGGWWMAGKVVEELVARRGTG